MKKFYLLLIFAIFASTVGFKGCEDPRPNILFIVADDLGFTDLGVTGGEIATPNLDILASEGRLMTDFHVAPTCAVTRAALLTGMDHHKAGVGIMAELPRTPEQQASPNYQGFLKPEAVTIAEILKDEGYHTYMTGKWHLGLDRAQAPDRRGFEKSYVLLRGGAGHVDMSAIHRKDATGADPSEYGNIAPYREDGEWVTPEKFPKNFFSSKFYTDKLIAYIDQGKDDGKPFFAYAAYTAPHWPLQLPDEEWLRAYEGRYDAGYDVLRQERLNRLKEMGLIADDVEAFPHHIPSWDTLSDEEKALESRKMEIYAAMVENLDYHIGRLLDHLRDIGEYENTLIVFISDNGPAGEDALFVNRTGVHHYPDDWPYPQLPDLPPFHPIVNAYIAQFEANNTLDGMGKAGSFVSYQTRWAQVGSVPSRLYKAQITQGGTHSPAIFKLPRGRQADTVSTAYATVMDLVPTVLDFVGAEHPATYDGMDTLPMDGSSMMAHLKGKRKWVHSKREPIGWEFWGQTALRMGSYKMLNMDRTLPNGVCPPENTDGWELFDLSADPAETTNLVNDPDYADILTDMMDGWDDYVFNKGIILQPGCPQP